MDQSAIRILSFHIEIGHLDRACMSYARVGGKVLHLLSNINIREVFSESTDTSIRFLRPTLSECWQGREA